MNDNLSMAPEYIISLVRDEFREIRTAFDKLCRRNLAMPTRHDIN